MKESGNYKNWPDKKFNYVEKQYKNFLYLCRIYPGQNFPPPEDVDKFWHEHILDTDRYIRDCQRIYGQYKSHSPYAMDEVDDSVVQRFDLLQKMYKKHFGTYIYDFSEDSLEA